MSDPSNCHLLDEVRLVQAMIRVVAEWIRQQLAEDVVEIGGGIEERRKCIIGASMQSDVMGPNVQ